jgi:hypothetical protein
MRFSNRPFHAPFAPPPAPDSASAFQKPAGVAIFIIAGDFFDRP